MVAHPQKLSDKQLYAIDQWTLGGGAALIFVDPHAENQVGPRGQPPEDSSSSLARLFEAWGVGFDLTRTVADPNLALQTERVIDGRPEAIRRNCEDSLRRRLSPINAKRLIAVDDGVALTDCGFGIDRRVVEGYLRLRLFQTVCPVGRHHIGARQRVTRPTRKVGEIADRRGDHLEPPARRTRSCLPSHYNRAPQTPMRAASCTPLPADSIQDPTR
jgi:hypothetical protein